MKIDIDAHVASVVEYIITELEKGELAGSKHQSSGGKCSTPTKKASQEVTATAIETSVENVQPRRPGLRVRPANQQQQFTTTPSKKRKLNDLVAGLKSENAAFDDKENVAVSGEQNTPPKRSRTSRKQVKPSKVDKENVPPPSLLPFSSMEIIQNNYTRAELEVAGFLAEREAFRLLHPNQQQQPIILPQQNAATALFGETGSLELECDADELYDDYLCSYQKAMTNTADGQLPEFQTATTASSITVNRIVTPSNALPNEVSYGQVFECYTDECGLTVCRAVLPTEQQQPPSRPTAETEMMKSVATETSDSLDEDEENDENEVEESEMKVVLIETKKRKKSTGSIEDTMAAPEKKTPKKLKFNDDFNLPAPPNDGSIEQFIYDDKDLISLEGKNLLMYSMSVARALFTREELTNSLLADEKNKVRSKLNKTALDHERVDVLIEAICRRFKMTRDKLPWNKIRPVLNVRFSSLGRHPNKKLKKDETSNPSVQHA